MRSSKGCQALVKYQGEILDSVQPDGPCQLSIQAVDLLRRS